MDHQINESQCGFPANRGCNEQLFNLRILMQRAKKYNTALYLCFVIYPKHMTQSIAKPYGKCYAAHTTCQSRY